MTAEKTYQSLRADVSSRIELKLKELQALTADDIIDMYKAEAEKLSVLDGKYPGTGGIRTFITGRDKFTYDFIDLDQYYVKKEVDEMLEEEKKEREEADEALDERMTDWENRLEKEIEERKEADADLSDQIDKEVERAKEAEADLQQQINDEISRATAAEEDLQNQLNNEIARAEATEKDLQNQLNDEISRAKDTEADLLDQLNKEITRAETTEANEEAARKAADQNIVNWSKGHFVDVISTIGDSPLTLETSCNYDSDGYKVYTIHGTVDCYSKHEIDEVVDGLEQSDYQLQQGIDNVQDSVNNVQSGVDNLLASMQSQIDAITANYITSIGTDTTSPLFLSTNKSGNSVTISGHVDLTDYYTKSEIDSFLNDIISSINIGLDSKQDVLTAGTGIDITDNVISCTLDNTVFKIVEQLPTSDINTNVIYVVTGETTGEGDNLYSEYIYVNGQWEKIGEFKSDTDLSDYYTKGETYNRTEISNLIDDAINSIDLSEYQKKLQWYDEDDGFAQIAVTTNGPQFMLDYSGQTALLNADNSVVINTALLSYNNCEVATQCWVQDNYDLSQYYTKDDTYNRSEISELITNAVNGINLSGYQKKLAYYHENVNEDADVVFSHITANANNYTLDDGTVVTSPNLAQYRLQYIKPGCALSQENVWWTTDYEGEEVTTLLQVVKCVNEEKRPRTAYNAYPDFFEWIVDQELGSDYSQKLVLDRNGLWLNKVKLGAGGDVDLSDYYTKEDIDKMFAELSSSASTWIAYGSEKITAGGTALDRISLLPSSSYGTPKVGDAVLYFYVNYDDPQYVIICNVKAVSDSTVTVSYICEFEINSGSSTDLSNYYTKSEIDEMLDEIKAGDVDLSGYQKKLELYSETSSSATIETPNVGYGIISTVWSGGNSNMMTITTDNGNTIMYGNYIQVTGSNGVGSITVDGKQVLTEADFSKDDISNLLEYYNYNNSVATSINDKTSNVHVLEVEGDGSSSRIFSLSGSSIPEGREMYWIIHNTGTGTVTYQFGSLTSYHHICVDGNDTLTIQPGEYGEFSMISDGTNGYIRSSSQS